MPKQLFLLISVIFLFAQLLSASPELTAAPVPMPPSPPLDSKAVPAQVLGLAPERTPESTPERIRQIVPAAGLTKEVIGYYAEDWAGDKRSLTSVKSYGSKMAAIATFSYQLKADGTLDGAPPATALTQAHNNGSKALLLIHNYVNGAFDRGIVHTVLGNRALRSKLVDNILRLIKQHGYDGVNIDLENIRPADRSLLTQFMAELSETLHSDGYLVTISVPAKTRDEQQGWGGAFDYQALGQYADRIMLMTYDEHWFGGSPGPVASINWVKQVIKFAAGQIPASKLELGLGMYGYEWDALTGQSVRALPTKKALELAERCNASVNWDNTAKVPYFYYWVNGTKRVVWFESNQSAALKMDLVHEFDLAGVAVWKLGNDDNGFWQLVNSKF